MSSSLPQYVLFSSSTGGAGSESRWSFFLEQQDGPHQVRAADAEPDLRGERLQLLAIVRGLEALDEPSLVTVVTDSSYAYRGLAHGMDEWRANGWTWEAFGKMVPIKNRDLWQRIDRAMIYHQVDCQRRRVKQPRQPVPAPHFPMAQYSPVAQCGSNPKRDAARVPKGHRFRGRIEGCVHRLAVWLGRNSWAPTGSGSC